MTGAPPPAPPPHGPRPAAPDDVPACTYCRGWRAVLLVNENLERFFVCRACDFAFNPNIGARVGPPNAG